MLLLLFAMSLAACESKPSSPVSNDVILPSDKVESTPKVEIPTQLDWTGPTERLALPHKILAMRMEKASSVGSIAAEGGKSISLDGFGLNLCQTGWVFQGFSRPDGKYTSTPVFQVFRAEIPLGKKFEYSIPSITDSYIEFDMSAWSLTHVKGTIRFMDRKRPGKELLVMAVDGAPISIAAAPGYGAQGCFTTGYYRINENKQGPVTAVWDGANLFYVSMRLDEKRAIALEFALRAHQRKPDNILQMRLARVLEEPLKFPIRAYFETRVDRDLAEGETGATHEVKRVPMATGKLRAVFMSQSPAGPVRVDLSEVELPEDFGTWEGVKELNLRLEALFVTDLKGRRVPVPAPPKWDLSPEAAIKAASELQKN